MPTGRRTVTVNLQPKPYDIHVQRGILHDVGMIVARLAAESKQVCVLTDAQVGPHYAAPLTAGFLNAGIRPTVAVVQAGENHKHLSTLLPVYDQFLGQKIERSTPVIALGGGVVGDMAGFVAATILRGVPFVQVPTTLLAMVDASVGGKTGVDSPAGKNLIGAFHQPIAVLIDPSVLQTLPRRELISGLAECIKHEIIRDADGFASLEHNIGKALELDIEFLAALIAHNVAIKARVVEADPFERGERAHLNFGHTFGHAIETISNYSYSHGECVALGMVAASNLAKELDLIDESSRKRIMALIDAAGLPTGGLKLGTDEVVNAMFFDKKVAGGKLRLILPERIGAVTIRNDVAIEAVKDAVESIRG
jgi:3-dehydroquinate synthase